MADLYVLLNQSFCTANHGYRNENGIFNYRQDNDGYYLAAEQSIRDFPELFDNSPYLTLGMPIVDRTVNDFPQDNNPG